MIIFSHSINQLTGELLQVQYSSDLIAIGQGFVDKEGKPKRVCNGPSFSPRQLSDVISLLLEVQQFHIDLLEGDLQGHRSAMNEVGAND